MIEAPVPAAAFLLFLTAAWTVPARAAQMEGPTVYEVEPSLAVITNDVKLVRLALLLAALPFVC